MGLAERRRIKQLAEEHLPAFTRSFQEQTGLTIPIEFDGAVLEKSTDQGAVNVALDWLTGYNNSGEFWNEPIAAWRDFVRDELGRATVIALVATWRVTSDPAVPTGLVLRNGVLVQNANFAQDGSAARLWARDFGEQLERVLHVDGLTLGERRRIKRIHEEVVPAQQAALAAAVGGVIPLAVVDNFASMPAGDARQGTLSWLAGETNSGEFWTELQSGLAAVCSDEMGREALRAAVQRIEVGWSAGQAASVRIDGGVLRYAYNWIDSPGAYRLWAREIQEAIEADL